MEEGMSITSTNILVGTGVLYLGAFGATEPADTAVNASPAASAWTDAGATDGGMELMANQSFFDYTPDQTTMPVVSVITARTFTLKTNLAEATLENLAYALNTSAPATGSGVKTLEPDVDSGVVTAVAAIFDGTAPSGLRRRVIARKVHSVDNVGLSYKKDGVVLVPVTLRCLYVSSAIKPCKFVDQTS
jgi:hypothetical protein